MLDIGGATRTIGPASATLQQSSYFAVPFPGKHARGWVILCDPIWHVSSRRDEACCEVVRSVYLTYTALSFCA